MKTLPRLALILSAAGLPAAQAFVWNIQIGQRTLYLQVGVGTMTGASTFTAAGVPVNNFTRNIVSVSVQTAELGMPNSPQILLSDSTVTNSPYNGNAICSRPDTTGQVYVGGFYRSGISSNGATLSVATTANHLAARTAGNIDTIPFSSITWTSSAIGTTASPTVPNGAFTSNSVVRQTLMAVSRNTWFENCLTFRYLNTRMLAADTYEGTATFTLTSP